MAVNVTSAAHFEQLIAEHQNVLVDFWAVWCGPCRMIAPLLDEISAERDDIVVCKVNVDELPELASKFSIMSIPTLLAFESGKLSQTMIGVHAKSEILAMFCE